MRSIFVVRKVNWVEVPSGVALTFFKGGMSYSINGNLIVLDDDSVVALEEVFTGEAMFVDLQDLDKLRSKNMLLNYANPIDLGVVRELDWGYDGTVVKLENFLRLWESCPDNLLIGKQYIISSNARWDIVGDVGRVYDSYRYLRRRKGLNN